MQNLTDKIKGQVHKLGKNIDTDIIIPAQYLTTFDPAELAKHCLEPLKEDFIAQVKPGDVIVAEENFGCGSSREHAPLAIKGTSVSAVIATSFARIFYRNAINTGLLVFELPELVKETNAGDIIEINLTDNQIKNLTTGKRYQIPPLPPFIAEIMAAGGLIEYVKKRKAAKAK